MKTIRIGTRGSALALAQTEWVKRALAQRYPELGVEIVRIKTSGDRFLTSPVPAIGKGIFVKEIEEALQEEKIDLAVHSMKDLPTAATAGLVIAAVPEREDARDALVTRGGGGRLADLPSGTRIGTGSLRRRAQLLHRRPDLHIVPIRGNVDTRLKKMDHGEVDGLLMAAAGLERLGLAERIGERLAPDICLPAPAQGALALQTRDRDEAVGLVEFLIHAPTMREAAAERALLDRLGGGCQLPIGARAWVEGENLKLAAVVADPDGRKVLREEREGSADAPERIGMELADRLLALGARQLLDDHS